MLPSPDRVWTRRLRENDESKRGTRENRKGATVGSRFCLVVVKNTKGTRPRILKAQGPCAQENGPFRGLVFFLTRRDVFPAISKFQPAKA